MSSEEALLPSGRSGGGFGWLRGGLFYRYICIDILATLEGIEEHVCHTEEIDEIAWHVTDTVGKEILEHGEHTATNDHHHENA